MHACQWGTLSSFFFKLAAPIDTAEDEHSRKYTRGLISTKKWILKNILKVPPVLGSTVKILEKAMVLSKGSFIGLLKVISGLVR